MGPDHQCGSNSETEMLIDVVVFVLQLILDQMYMNKTGDTLGPENNPIPDLPRRATICLLS